MAKITTVVRQLMGYFEMKNPEKYQFGRVPSLSYRDKTTNYFAIPDRKDQGYKIGEHVVTNKSYVDNTEYRVELLKEKAKELFGDKIIKLNKAE